MIDLKGNPFFLSSEQIAWVRSSLAGMSSKEKLQQLFVQAYFDAPEQLTGWLETNKPGGVRCFPADLDEARRLTAQYQHDSAIPLLIPLNCDNGGDSVCSGGTYISTAAGAAAAQGDQTAYDMGYVAAREAREAGFNWLFNPCADIFPFSLVEKESRP